MAGIVDNGLSARGRMPSLSDATSWVNSEPLEPEHLRGHVVLVNFWTLTCINWLRQEPYVRAWSQSYQDDGLIVVGVHTPEFSFEHDVGLVRRATQDRRIDYPVAIDNEYRIWTAFNNRYWPARYIVDRDGIIRDHHFGEGRYAESEQVLQRLLGVSRAIVPVRGVGPEAEADWDNLRSPETYLGYERGAQFASADEVVFGRRCAYRLPDRLPLNGWALGGEWTIGRDKVRLDQAGGSIRYRFHSRDAHLVLWGGTGSSISFQVLLDGEAPGDSRGLDVDPDGNGVLGEGRLYQLIRQPGPIRDRTLTVTFGGPGAEAYAFTFG